MSRNLSAEAKKAIFAARTRESFITLLTISHGSFLQPIRIADDAYQHLPLAGQPGVISRGMEFVYLPFRIVLPASDDTGVSRAKIAIDNIDRKMVQAARSADSALEVTIEIVLSSQPNVVEMAEENFRLEKVDYDALVVSGEISVEYYDLEPYPAGRFTPSGFPGMF